MSKMMQIRNAPATAHRALKVKAANAGMSLSEYLLRRISEDAHQLTLEEWFERVRQREPVQLDEDPAVTIRRMRGPLRGP